MARGTSLSQLRDQLRAEIGASPNPAMGTNAVHQMNLLLSRTQERLWTDFDWPLFSVSRDIELKDGQRYYAFPNDLDFGRINQTEVKYSSVWRPMEYGIGNADYNFMDSDEGERQDPALKWSTYEGGTQFEVWPIPASNDMTLRFTGIRKLAPLIADTDVCELDDHLLTLYAAAEMLSHNKSPDAPAKLNLANVHYARLRGLSGKGGLTTYGGGSPGVKPGYRMIGGKVQN
jgi:hypothetical protein